MNSKKILELLKAAPVTVGYSNADHVLHAWGARSFKANDDASVYGICHLSFDVHGTNFKGRIKIAPASDAGFNVFFEQINNITGSTKSFQRLTDVPIEKLIDAIDAVIEPQDNDIKPKKEGQIKFDSKEWAENFLSVLARNGNYLSTELVQTWFEKIFELGKNS